MTVGKYRQRAVGKCLEVLGDPGRAGDHKLMLLWAAMPVRRRWWFWVHPQFAEHHRLLRVAIMRPASSPEPTPDVFQMDRAGEPVMPVTRPPLPIADAAIAAAIQADLLQQADDNPF